MTRPWHCMSLWRRLIHKKIKLQSRFIYILYFFARLICCHNCCYFAVEYPVPQSGRVVFTADLCIGPRLKEVIFFRSLGKPCECQTVSVLSRAQTLKARTKCVLSFGLC